MTENFNPYAPPVATAEDEDQAIAEALRAGKGTRRRRLMGGRRKGYLVRVSDAEEGYLTRLALAHRVSVPRLLVESTMVAGSGETLSERRAVIANLFALYRLVANIGNNVNQIAKATNATGEVAAELSATLEHVRRTAMRIDALIGEIGLTPRGDRR